MKTAATSSREFGLTVADVPHARMADATRLLGHVPCGAVQPLIPRLRGSGDGALTSIHSMPEWQIVPACAAEKPEVGWLTCPCFGGVGAGVPTSAVAEFDGPCMVDTIDFRGVSKGVFLDYFEASCSVDDGMDPAGTFDTSKLIDAGTYSTL